MGRGYQHLFYSLPQKKGQQSMTSQPKVLVAYFSATGNTAQTAKTLADLTDGTLYEIAPQEPYTSADLDWHDKQSRSSVEMNEAKSRPAMKENPKDIATYDVVFIGYPIWWNLAPCIIYTFIESHDLKGKALIPFATSGGSGIANSIKALKSIYPDLKWQEGKLLNRSSRSSIQNWVSDVMKNNTPL